VNTLPQSPPIEFPALTAAEIAAALGVSSQAVRKKLRSIPATGKRTAGGNVADTWRLGNLPEALLARLKRASAGNDLVSVAQMFTGGFKQWTPPVPLADIADESLTEADKLKRALVPSLRRQFVITQGGFERDGVKDYEKVFGRKITTRHFRELIRRTVQRAGSLENWERLELYLPAKLERKQAITERPQQFPGLVSVINAGAAPDEIWKKTFQLHDELVQAGRPRNRVARQLRAFIIEHKPDLAPSPDALLKAFNRKLERHQAGETFDQRADNGADDSELTKQIKSLPWFLPAAEFFYLITNRTRDTGSVPEAIRRVISLPNLPAGWSNTVKKRFLKKVRFKKIVPTCPDVVREAILAREKSGQSLVSASVSKAITTKVSRLVIENYRRPHEAALNNLQCPGTMMMVRRDGCEPQFARAGDIIEADDGSINFPVCIPWTSPAGGLITNTPCSEKFGVIVGRFQWLRSMDVATRFRPGWVFVARSRGGYRGEDVLTLMNGLTRQHGAWEEYRFERGVFKSDRVKQAAQLLGSRLHTVNSPHSKPFIEGGFNQDWTKLSVHFPQCDIGRYRGDTEAANKILQSCRRGADDPRRYFPMLTDALAAFAQITEEENRTLVKSRNSGQWVPEDRWQRETSQQALRRLDDSKLFMFAPCAKEWTVRGMLVGGRVPIFDDMSVPFDFSAHWLHEFDGARMRLYFDPSAPNCSATPVLLQDWHGHKAGEVLPPLQQVNETTGYVRMVLGWGNDSNTAGLKAKQQSAVSMRREVRTVMPGGKSGYTKSEVKALGSSGIVEHATGTESASLPDSAKLSTSRLIESLDYESPEEKEEYSRECDRSSSEEQRRFTENFERNHPKLLV
jgi:hypothetical protein